MAELQFRQYKNTPDGTYRFVVEGVQEVAGKFGPSLQWKSKIVDGSEFDGNVVNYLTSAQFGPSSKTYKFLKVLGMQDLEEDVNINPEAFIGQEFYGKVEIKAQGDKEYSNITEIWSREEFEKMLENFTKQNASVVIKKTSDAPPPADESPSVPPVTTQAPPAEVPKVDPLKKPLKTTPASDLKFPVKKK